MFINTKCLLEACKNLKLEHRLVDPKSNFIEVIINKRPYFSVNNSCPLNSASDVNLTKDKDFTYKTLNGVINMPKTYSYLDPNTPDQFKKYLKFNSYDEILKDITSKFKFPVIIKMNQGSRGINIFKCSTQEEVNKSIRTILNHNSQYYDYVALAQEFIDIEEEYRVIVLDGKIEFAYIKNNKIAKFVGNLSPLHFEGANSILIQDSEKIAKLQKFIDPIFSKLAIRYSGLDVVLSKNNELFLLELNSKPGFEYFARDNGTELIVQLYEKVLKKLSLYTDNI